MIVMFRLVVFRVMAATMFVVVIMIFGLGNAGQREQTDCCDCDGTKSAEIRNRFFFI